MVDGIDAERRFEPSETRRDKNLKTQYRQAAKGERDRELAKKRAPDRSRGCQHEDERHEGKRGIERHAKGTTYEPLRISETARCRA